MRDIGCRGLPAARATRRSRNARSGKRPSGKKSHLKLQHNYREEGKPKFLICEDYLTASVWAYVARPRARPSPGNGSGGARSHTTSKSGHIFIAAQFGASVIRDAPWKGACFNLRSHWLVGSSFDSPDAGKSLGLGAAPPSGLTALSPWRGKKRSVR